MMTRNQHWRSQWHTGGSKQRRANRQFKNFRLEIRPVVLRQSRSAESDWAIAGWCCCTLSGTLRFVVVFSWTTAREGRKSCVPALPSVDRARLQSCVLDGRPVSGVPIGFEPASTASPETGATCSGKRSSASVNRRCCPAASWLRVPLAKATNFFSTNQERPRQPEGSRDVQIFLSRALSCAPRGHCCAPSQPSHGESATEVTENTEVLSQCPPSVSSVPSVAICLRICIRIPSAGQPGQASVFVARVRVFLFGPGAEAIRGMFERRDSPAIHRAECEVCARPAFFEVMVRFAFPSPRIPHRDLAQFRSLPSRHARLMICPYAPIFMQCPGDQPPFREI